MENMSISCFVGSPSKVPWWWRKNRKNESTEILKKKLRLEMIHLIDKGVNHFINGMETDTDIYAAETVLELRKAYIGLTLEVVIGNDLSLDAIKDNSHKTKYNDVIKSCDVKTIWETESTEAKDKYGYIMDKSEYILAVCNDEQDEIKDVIAKGEKTGKEVIMLYRNKLQG